MRALSAEEGDITTILRWENDTSIWRYGNTIAPYTYKMIWQYISDYSADINAQRQLRLMICLNETDEPIGMIDLFDYNPQRQYAYIGLLIDSNHQCKKYAQQSVELIKEYARKVLHLRNIAAEINSDNLSSRHVFEACGFKHVGTMKDWFEPGIDNCIYQVTL